jgi:dTDP-4-dehydrorhamnose reductase
MKKRKILVTGSLGTVGSYIPTIFTTDELFLTSRKDLDITNRKQVLEMITKVHPDVVIHLAAKTNVDDCQNNKKEARLVNESGTLNLAKACKINDSILVYISSGAVFNGKNKFFTENSRPAPINYYGKTKLLGEQAIKKSGCKFIIIRAGWIIGGGKQEKKFISYILKQIEDGRKELKVINDKFGTITSAKELVKQIKYLLKEQQCGTFHFGSSGSCSRFEIAEYIIKLLKINVIVKPVSSTIFQKKFSAPRPEHEVLKSIKLSSNHFRPWQDSLKNYILSELK